MNHPTRQPSERVLVEQNALAEVELSELVAVTGGFSAEMYKGPFAGQFQILLNELQSYGPNAPR